LVSVTTLPRGAAAQVCQDASLDYLSTDNESSGGSEPREMTLGSFNLDQYPDLAVQHRGSPEVGILLGDGPGFKLHTVLSFSGAISDVVAADFNHDGWDDVAVSVTARDQIHVRLSSRSGGFDDALVFPVGKQPTALAVGDFDDDGHFDVAAFNSGDFDVWILLGDGQGSFVPLTPIQVSVGSQLTQMAAGDVNEDGNLDLVAVDPARDLIYVALLKDTGDLDTLTSFTPAASRPEGLTLGDFDGDGALDLVTVAQTRQIEFLGGDGAGGFSTGAPRGTGAAAPTRVAAADLDNDGDLDVAVSDDGLDQVHLLVNDGKGNFVVNADFPSAGPSGDVVASDFDLDGRNDVALSIWSGGRIQTFLNDTGIGCPKASFHRLARLLPVDSPPKPIAVADFDRNGSLDFVTANLSAPSYTRYLGLGNGDFSSPESGFSWSLPTSNAAADFDFDGDVDVAVATGTSVFIQNNDAGSLASAASLPISNGIHVVATDVSADGKPDLVVLSSGTDVFVSLNDGAGGFPLSAGYALTGSPRAVAVADFDGDNLPDLAVAEAGVDWISLFQNLGAGAFTTTPVSMIGLPLGSPSAVKAADMNGDGRNDLVVTVGSGTGARLQTLTGNGAFGFSPNANVLLGDAAASPQALEVFDFNADGRRDVAVALASIPRVRVFGGTGSGGFAATTFTEMLPEPPGALASGDFDRDGDLDLLVSVPSRSEVYALMGNGAGRFSPAFLPAPAENADSRGVAHGDFDGKGFLDIVVANAEDDSVTVFLGQSGGGFDAPRTTPSLDKPVWVTADDFDNDGGLDVVVSAEGSRELGFHKGRRDGTFDPAVKTPLSGNPYITRSADFNFDGNPDLVGLVDSEVYFFRGDGSGAFSGSLIDSLGGLGSGLVVGDFDRDGLLDFAAAQTNDHRIMVFLGTGPGTFAFDSGITTLQTPLDFDAGDIDNDGFLDLVVPLEGTNEVRLLFGDGGGGFAVGPAGSVSTTPKVVRLLDYNLDGALDFVVASEADHVLGFYSGNGIGGFNKDDTRFASVRRPNWMTVADFDSDGRTDIAVVPSSAIDGDPSGVAAIRNTNCRARHLHLLQDVSTCDTPDLPFLSQPQLRVEDDGANLIECEARDVVASIRPGTGSAGASLLPPTSITPSSGIASYSSLGVDQGGAGFQIQFLLGDARPKLSRRFSQALAPVISGPAAICEGAPAVYTADAVYDYYDWRLDTSPVSMTPSIDLTGLLTPGLHDVDLFVVSDTCTGSTFQMVDVTAQLSDVDILPAGPVNVCEVCTGPMATSSVTGGGVVTYQWGYRTGAGGTLNFLAGETNPTYTIEGADFPGPGTYLLALRVTPACGLPLDSNDVEINVATSTGLDPLEAFTALATNASVRLEFSTTALGTCAGIRILRNSIDFPPNPHDTDPPNVWIGGADFPCPPSHEDDFTDVLVFNDNEYLYSAWVKDAGGSFSTAKHVKSVPFDTTGPVKWAYSTGATSMSEAGLRISGGQVSVYVVSNDTLVHALDGGALATGGFWIDNAKPFPLGLPSQVKPPVVPFQVGPTIGGALFVTSQDGNVYAINATSMSEIWPPAPVGGMLTGAASGLFSGFGGAKNLIFAGTRNAAPPNGIRSFDVETGVEQWFFSGGGTPVGVVLGGASVDYAGQRVVFASQQGPTPTPKTLWALDVSVDGSVSLDWAVDLGDIDGSPVFLGGGAPRVVVGTNAGLVHLRDASDGSSLWPAPYNAANGRVRGFVFPHTHGGVRYYMFATDGRVTSIRHNGDGVSPTLHWQLPFTSPSTPIALPGTTTALVGSGDGNLYLINGINTSTPTTVPLQLGDGSASVGTPTFDVVNRVIYVGTEDGVIRAITYPFP
jgi:hypothetical protein